MVNQNIEQLLQQAVDQSMEQTQESRELAEEVSGKMGEIDQKVDEKIIEMDSKISEATADIIAAIESQVNLILYVDPENGLPTNSGTSSNDAIDTISNAMGKILDGTYTVIYLKGGGIRHIIADVFDLKNSVVLFLSYATGSVKPVLTHSAYKSGNSINTNGFRLRFNSRLVFSGIDIETSRWQEWVDSGNAANYSSSLFMTSGNMASGGQLTITNGKITLNNSALIHQHVSSSYGYGWLEAIALLSVTVTKRDLSTDRLAYGNQYLVDQHGSGPIPWDFSTLGLGIDSGEVLTDLISSTVVTANVRSTATLTA